MFAYVLCLILLFGAIWYDKRQDRPNLDAALDELSGYDFDKNWWVSFDGMSALAIDSKMNKICLLRSFKGTQIIDYKQLLEFEIEEKSANPTAGLFRSLLDFFSRSKNEYTKIIITLLLDDLSQFDFSLVLYIGNSPKKIKYYKTQAQQILKILKVVQKRAEKLEKQSKHKRKKQYESYEYEDELLEVEDSSGIQTEFDFEPA